MWTCPKCQEENEDSYEVCFHCGTTPEGQEDPEFQEAEEADGQAAGDRPLVEVMPRTMIPEALQPSEPAPAPHPRWQAVRCPNCQSEDLARDAASPWPVIAAALLLALASLLLRDGGGAGAWLLGWACTVLGVIVLVSGLVAPFVTENAWCRNCGVRLRKRYRIDQPAEKEPDGPSSHGG